VVVVCRGYKGETRQNWQWRERFQKTFQEKVEEVLGGVKNRKSNAIWVKKFLSEEWVGKKGGGEDKIQKGLEDPHGKPVH